MRASPVPFSEGDRRLKPEDENIKLSGRQIRKNHGSPGPTTHHALLLMVHGKAGPQLKVCALFLVDVRQCPPVPSLDR